MNPHLWVIMCIVLLIWALRFLRTNSNRKISYKPLEVRDIQAMAPTQEKAAVVIDYFLKGFIATKEDVVYFLYFWGEQPIPRNINRDQMETILECTEMLYGGVVQIRGGAVDSEEMIPFMRSMFTQSK